MSNNECFVPNCSNTIGVPFPRDAETKQKWLEGLKVTDIIPKASSFVCFSHFHPSDLKEENATGTRLSNRLKRGAVPSIFNSTPTNDLEETREKANDENVESDAVDESEVLKNAEEKEIEKFPEIEKICRACMKPEDSLTNLFEYIEEDVMISSAFMMCVFPINVSETDTLPKQICQTCLSTLQIAYKFQKECIHTDDILRIRYPAPTRKRRTSNGDDTEKVSKKSRQKENSNDEACRVVEIGLDDTFEFIHRDTSEDISAKNAEDIVSTSSLNRRSVKLSGSQQAISAKSKKIKKNVDIDAIERNLEEIHGQNESPGKSEESDVSLNAEEEEQILDEDSTTVEDILNTLEEGSIPVDEGSNDDSILDEFLTKKEIAPLQKKIVVKTNFPLVQKKEIEIPSFIKLPKDVKIRPVEKYQSEIGKFSGSIRAGVYDSVFVQAGDYLFELGLIKGKFRHLRCTVPSCSAHAKQKFLENGELDSIVDVTLPHNHQVPNEPTKKKQMFLCVMRKKMQTDRTLNIRIIYEDACSEDPDIKQLVPLRNVINEICRHQLTYKMQPLNSFDDFYNAIDTDPFEKLHFTHNSQQFYQEKFACEEDGSKAILFGNSEVIQQVSVSKIMYVDASFKIDTNEEFKYQLVTILVWIEDSYYPIIFALVNKKSQQIFRKVFAYLRDDLAPELRPQEIITDYEANLYYALAEVYTESNIGGSVFYYTQNLYKKICSLNLSRDLETNSYFRNIYHMLLMLPLLPVNTINDGLNNIHLEATNLNIQNIALPIFDHVRNQWIINVTPELFCVHKLENRINENVIAPFKKLRDFLLLTKGKLSRTHVTVVHIIEKLIELEAFLRGTYSKPDKKSFGRDLSSFQKKNVLRAWQFIEDHPKIEINNFFSKVLGYIKCMENQLWIWGFYRYDGDTDDILINAAHFSIVSPNDELPDELEETLEDEEYVEYFETPENTIVMDAVIDQDGVLQTEDEILTTSDIDTTNEPQEFNAAYVKYVYQ